MFRRFCQLVNWATPENCSYLSFGHWDYVRENDADQICRQMLKNKDHQKRLKLLDNEIKRVYTNYLNPNHSKGLRNFPHDIKLRNCLALVIRKYPDAVIRVFEKGADADIHLNGTRYYFEFDNGTETTKKLVEKIKTHYQDDSLVVFVMRSRMDELEDSRVSKLRTILEGFPKRGRFFVGGYSEFTKDLKATNHRGELWDGLERNRSQKKN